MHPIAGFNGDHAKHLHASIAARRFRHDPGAFMDGLKAVPPQHCDVEQDIRLAAVGNDETIAFGRIEPFDAACDFYERKRMSVFCDANRLTAELKMRCRTVLAQFIGSPTEYSAVQQTTISNETNFGETLATATLSPPLGT
jgi:hypothetical protein